jgi:hypothetical protein
MFTYGSERGGKKEGKRRDTEIGRERKADRRKVKQSYGFVVHLCLLVLKI